MNKTTGYYHIVLGLAKLTILEEVNLALGLVYATDPVYITPSITQVALRALATTVQSDLGTRITLPNPTLTITEKQDVDALSRGLLTVKSEVEVAVNKHALGNRNLFDIVVNRIGFNSAKAHASHVRIFESKSVGIGMIQIIAPVEHGLGHPNLHISIWYYYCV